MRRAMVLALLPLLALWLGCSEFTLPKVGGQNQPCFGDGTCKDGGRCDADTNICGPPPAEGAEGDTETAPESDAEAEADAEADTAATPE